MFDPTQLLGGMLSGGVQRRHTRHRRASSAVPGVPGLGGLGGVAAGALGMAAIGGAAYFAYQAFKGSNAQPAPYDPQPYVAPYAQASQDPNMGYAPGAVPYYVQEQQRQQQVAAAAAAAAAPPPVASAPLSPPDRDTALLLVRAMVAAANADGQIDDEERRDMVEHLARAGLGPAEQAALAQELAHPLPPSALMAGIRTPAMAEQVYTVSLVAIDVPGDAEKAYLRGLAAMLNLSPAVVARLEAQLAPPT